MSTDAPLTIDLATLPDDPALLKRLWEQERIEREQRIIQQEQRFTEVSALIERIREEAAQQLTAERERHAAELKAAIQALLRRYYGPRSESFDPRQLLLFGQVIEQMPLDERSIEEEVGEKLTTRRVKNRHKHGRQQLPESLERIEIEHDLKPEEKACPACGCERCRIGQEISEQLEYFPANFKVLKHIRHKYACAKCNEEGYNPNIAAAKKPAQPIDKGLPGPSLLAYVITSKLGDHLPLYRLENIFARQGVQIARSTMCAWMLAASELVKPLVELMAARVKLSRVIHTDDTTVPVLPAAADRTRRKGNPCKKGRIWTYLGDEANPYTVYDYTPSRKRDGPAAWLSGYQGYLQADAYSAYDGIYLVQGAVSNVTQGVVSNATQGVFEVACWAHARRKFYDAQDSDGRRAVQMLALIGELYTIEREAKERAPASAGRLDEAMLLALRHERSVPVLEKIKTWLETEGEIVLPRSPMMAAITYAQNQWAALNVYVTQGFLNIDNNAAERALKRVAISRKNWLFAGNDTAAASHARLWSLIASAERHGLDPQRYLTSVLAKIGQTPRDVVGNISATDLAQFLPDVWKREDAEIPPTLSPT